MRARYVRPVVFLGGNLMSVTSTAPVTGKRIYFVGHSFHMFIVRPLISLAKEAGITGHWAEGWDMIGGSTPSQHWDRNGDENEPKKAIRSGRVEVLTLASNVILPEPAIDHFADLAVEHNPAVRVMVQHSWGDASTGLIMRARHSGAAALPEGIPTNEDRDRATAADLADHRASSEAQRATLRRQITGINDRHGRELAHLVPAGEAVLQLREAVVAGALPGVRRQSELFRDALGHATQPTTDLVSYLWFAALYGRSPVGSTCLVDATQPDAAAQHAVLQEMAWRVAVAEPLSGVSVPA